MSRRGSAAPRRPKYETCGECGERMHLSRCGVDEHMHLSAQEVRQVGCNGRVYIHERTGGMDCHP